MTPEFSPTLAPPLLLATDGSPSAQLAQAVVQPLATLVASMTEPHADALPEVLIVVTVQPRAQRRLPSPKLPALRDRRTTTESTTIASGDTVASDTVASRDTVASGDDGSADVLVSDMTATAGDGTPTRVAPGVVSADGIPTDGIVADDSATAPIATLPTEPSGATEPTTPHRRSHLGLTLEQLTHLIRRDFPADFPLSLQVRYGRPTTEILNCARSTGAGLIAVGHRGTGGMRELLLGSVSTAIARYAPCSVLVARSTSKPANGTTPVPEPTPLSATLTHVLVAIDGSHASRHALETVKFLRAAGIETVTLLHIQPPLNTNYLVAPFVAHSPSWQLNQSLQAAQREQGEEVLRKAAALLAETELTVQTRLHVGEAGPGICQIAQAVGADLILLGNDAVRRSLLSPLQAMRLPRRNAAQSRPVLRNTRLSVTDDYVIHYAPCPVLLCRAIAATP